MNSIKFSVTIPAYKGKFLSEAISSVLKQTYENFELIIVDDCSPEDLMSIISKYNDSRIRYYRNVKNFGALNVVDNWNKCLSYSLGNYVICMGDDDCLKPSCLEEYFKLINKYPNLEVYHSWTEIIDQSSQIISIQQPRPEYETGLSLMWNRWNGRNKQYIGDFCFEVHTLRKRGGFYKLPLAWASDDISAVRAAMSNGIANTNKIGFQYRENNLTITNSSNHDIKLEAAFLERKWYLDLYSTINTSYLSSTDRIYYSLIKNEIHDHFYNQRQVCLINIFKNRPFQILTYLLKCTQLELSFKILLLYWIKGLKLRLCS